MNGCREYVLSYSAETRHGHAKQHVKHIYVKL